MPILTNPSIIRQQLRVAGETGPPLLCPNAETPDEMEGVLEGAARHVASGQLKGVTVGIGITGGYPDHPQLAYLGSCDEPGDREEAARKWFAWLEAAAAGRRFQGVSIIPFFDHGWVPDPTDLKLMRAKWFQKAMGIIMFDASKFSFEENVRLTLDFVKDAGSDVVIEGCPDKVYEKEEVENLKLTAEDLLSNPSKVEKFVQRTGVDIVVPNLGTEHRSSAGRQASYGSVLAKDIGSRIGARMALHGTSSLGGRLGEVQADGICKINIYTAIARNASEGVRALWNHGHELGIQQACGSFIFRNRRETVAQSVFQYLSTLNALRAPTTNDIAPGNVAPLPGLTPYVDGFRWLTPTG